jgi:hypothetical protein
MTSIRTIGLTICVVVLMGLGSQAFAQNVHQVPEGGSELIYLVLTGASCFGVMFYSRKGRSR